MPKIHLKLLIAAYIFIYIIYFTYTVPPYHIECIESWTFMSTDYVPIHMAMCVKTYSTPVVHIKIAGKWMFIPLKMYL